MAGANKFKPGEAITNHPIREFERRSYQTAQENQHVLSDDDQAALHSMGEDEFIRKVIRRPWVAIAKEMAKRGML